ncbi:DUF2520 domain-containing protein [Burkholderia dolosa]|uniref:DUF2520 domain-containing protein n=1 Tax=Burkholderia dolosa TaxID=152500 RepID=A0A892I6I1_9BURK|nr:MULTISPECIES: DUF2520 domain-containing protein [Burkholderia]AKE04361.1 NADP oxidoreductase [Burkholderia cepacia]AJY12043.1 NAD binding domain of 6-phosphogluconate dehydrogenase family protein [Burkholderia dolosa AU0158]AYZ96308.1 DUF2520 domain-containing protein [Burkholderia dolosa]EAY69505.1 hypothetical protein BDAG_02265 [Burkholderia dolosa AU0158]ETP66168.1 NADP oxidoreductase [Burkholderia dolosa PC543]
MSVPDTPRLGFIGAGRLARCVAQRFAQAGFPVVAIASRTRESAAAVAARIDGCQAVDTPQHVVDAADLIFLTVPDDHLASSAAALRFDASRAAGQALVHCSGASPVDLLDPAKRQRAATGGFHPLYLFGGTDADLARIDGCSVTIEADGALHATLVRLAGALGCHPLSIPAGGRMLYHAAAHYAASFALCGLSEAVELWRDLGFDEEAALRALLPMLAGTIETARDKGLANALAGPVSRGDTTIVERQLALLEARGGDHATLYALMTRRAVALAAKRTVPPASLPALAEAVETSLARAAAHPSPSQDEA